MKAHWCEGLAPGSIWFKEGKVLKEHTPHELMCFTGCSLPPLQPLFWNVTAILGSTRQLRRTAVLAVPINRQFNAESFASRASSSSDYCYVITRGGGTVRDHIRVLSALPLHELSIANKCSEKAITSDCLGAADAATVAPLLSWND